MNNITQKLLSRFPLTVSILSFLVFSFQSLIAHWSYNTHGFDLGVYVQSVYLYSQGESAYNTIADIHALANHFEPILIVMAPLYALLPTPEVLLLIQALFVSISIFPIYKTALHITSDIKTARALTILYITSSGVLQAIIWDFHSTTISLFPLSLFL